MWPRSDRQVDAREPMKRILPGTAYVLLALWLAFDPFSKAPIHPDPMGQAFAYISGVFILLSGWAFLRKKDTDDRPDW
jgi:hypothetical protein